MAKRGPIGGSCAKWGPAAISGGNAQKSDLPEMWNQFVLRSSASAAGRIHLRKPPKSEKNGTREAHAGSRISHASAWRTPPPDAAARGKTSAAPVTPTPLANPTTPSATAAPTPAGEAAPTVESRAHVAQPKVADRRWRSPLPIGVSGPIRVLANNDVPKGAACLRVRCPLAGAPQPHPSAILPLRHCVLSLAVFAPLAFPW